MDQLPPMTPQQQKEHDRVKRLADAHGVKMTRLNARVWQFNGKHTSFVINDLRLVRERDFAPIWNHRVA